MTSIFFYILLGNLWLGGTGYVYNQKLDGWRGIGDFTISLFLWPSVIFARILLKALGDVNK